MLSSAVDFMITSMIQQSKGLSKDSVNILVHRLLIKILEFSVSIKIIPIKCLNGVKSAVTGEFIFLQHLVFAL